MSVSFDKVQPGDVLIDAHKYRMGNTTMRALGVWEVRVISVDREARTAVVSWNGNAPRVYHERSFASLRRHAPEWIYEPFRGTRCYHCRADKTEGHRPDCDHPRAVSARKRAAK